MSSTHRLPYIAKLPVSGLIHSGFRVRDEEGVVAVVLAKFLLIMLAIAFVGVGILYSSITSRAFQFFLLGVVCTIIFCIVH